MSDLHTYYYCYNNNLDGLIDKMQVRVLCCNLNTNMDAENDVFLVHAIYYIIRRSSIYRKIEIKDKIWGMLKSSVESIYPDNEEQKRCKDGYEKLFDFCFDRKFEKPNSKKSVRLSKIAYRNMPFYKKCYNGNFALITFFCLFVLLQNWIHNLYCPWDFADNTISTFFIKTVFVLYSGVVLSGACRKDSLIPIFAFAIMIGVAFYHIFTSPYWDINAINVAKRDIIIAFAYLLWFPILQLNKERLDTLYSKQKRS